MKRTFFPHENDDDDDGYFSGGLSALKAGKLLDAVSLFSKA